MAASKEFNTASTGKKPQQGDVRSPTNSARAAFQQRQQRDSDAMARQDLQRRTADLKAAAQDLRTRAAAMKRQAGQTLKHAARDIRQAGAQQQASHDQLRARATAEVDARMKAERQGLEQNHQAAVARQNNIRAQDIRSFAATRAEAETRYLEQLKAVDQREQRAFQELTKQQRSLRGRLTRLVKGKGHHDRQNEELARKFESERLQRHRQFEAQQASRGREEQAARLRYGRDMKAMEEAHGRDREQMGNRHAFTRDRLIADRVASMTAAQQQAATQARQQNREPRTMRQAFERESMGRSR